MHRPGAKRQLKAERTYFIESSALVAALLERDEPAQASIEGSAAISASALTFAEARRAIVRAMVSGRLSAGAEKEAQRKLERVMHRCYVMNVNQRVLQRAGEPFPVEPIRTLDAIHLASIELLGVTPNLITVVTRDLRVRQNAAALGYSVE